jgi:hypothetical protein
MRDSRTYLLSVMPLEVTSLELKSLLRLKTQLLSITWSNSWKEKNWMPSTMDTHTSHSTWHQSMLLACHISMTLSQLQPTTGSQDTELSVQCITLGNQVLTLEQEISTVTSTRITDHHTDVITPGMTHLSTTNISKQKELMLRLWEAFTRREMLSQHELKSLIEKILDLKWVKVKFI